jgi:ABC-2 type transport system permease protein
VKRVLQLLRAEFIRDLTTSLRYPMELLAGLFIMFSLFMGLITGAKSLAGGQLQAGTQEQAVVIYCMWFLAIVSLNSMSVDIENEARQGTLEQLFLCSPSFLGLLWIRGAVHLLTGSSMVVVLSLVLQAATSHWLHLEAPAVGPVALAIVLTTLGLLGFGLILGGLSLVFKRIGQLAAILQFGFFVLAFLNLTSLSVSAQAVVANLPFTRGVDILKHLLAPPGTAQALGPASPAIWHSLGWLAADSLVYAVLGSFVFVAMERVARRQGALGHY